MRIAFIRVARTTSKFFFYLICELHSTQLQVLTMGRLWFPLTIILTLRFYGLRLTIYGEFACNVQFHFNISLIIVSGNHNLSTSFPKMELLSGMECECIYAKTTCVDDFNICENRRLVRYNKISRLIYCIYATFLLFINTCPSHY